MYHNDHTPPHFHVRYEKKEAVVSIDDFKILKGKLPNRVMGLVFEWANLHREELKQEWELARNNKDLFKIKPLV